MALLPIAAVAADPAQPKAEEAVKSIAVPIRHITPGIEVLLSDRLELLKGKRVALLTNQTGVDRKGVSNVDLLRAHPAINLVALFSPEHGVRGAAQAGEKVASGIDPKSGLPVHSLYGETKMPTAKMMQGIDIVLVDLQDVGTRFYTYASTLLYMLRAAETSGSEVIVLDRPNPQGGMMIEGPVLEPAFASFVGSYAVPVRHGMTFGELAQMFVGEDRLRTRLRVIAMRGWSRDLAPYLAWDLPWVPPSPNMLSPRTAAVYPGTALFEGTNISEGRGSEKPFEYIGGPFIDGAALAERLNAMGLPGVDFKPVAFTPDFSKYAGQHCHGVWVIPTNSKTFQPFRTGIALVKTVHDMYPDKFEFRPGAPSFFDQLAGTDSVRKGILDGKSVSYIERQWQDGLNAFMHVRARYLMYH
ncbi:exo-beta-N-acetylmuramidase NamZ domain-containing protein [Sphingorhabdus sp.]|uniref:exo-beta-N-acetylmuramidase NamZ family protein n=1 Tax=Sphingorhabdus sp. TaxID=1902408 RepID=UPI0037CB09C8